MSNKKVNRVENMKAIDGCFTICKYPIGPMTIDIPDDTPELTEALVKDAEDAIKVYWDTKKEL